MCKRYGFVVLFVLLGIFPLFSQPTLIFKRIELQFPNVKLKFRVDCQGKFRNDIDSQYFEVRENGRIIGNWKLTCPPAEDCCVSATLVLDRTGSMAKDDKIENLKRGAISYVESMNKDGVPCDEASIVSFGKRPGEVGITEDVPYLTTDKNVLLQKISAMRASGETPLWDAIYVGVNQIKTSTNHCKALIVLTDGDDNASQRSYDEAKDYAVAMNVRVFTIGYGVQAGAPLEGPLQKLADSTGGQYYRFDVGDDLSIIYSRMKEHIKNSYKECDIQYTSTCPDGLERTVELIVKNYCGGSDSAVLTYRPPLDESQFRIAALQLGERTAKSGNEVSVPVYLDMPIDAVFGKSSFVVQWNENGVLGFRRVATDGTLLENVPVVPSVIGNTVIVSIDEHSMQKGSGVLCYLVFRAGDIAAEIHINLKLSRWDFEARCLTPNLIDGNVTILPRHPKLSCQTQSPLRVEWDDANKQYIPNPFTYTTRISNHGDREAENLRATLTISSTAVIPINPAGVTQTVTPSTLDTNASVEVQWSLQVLKQENLDSVRICVTIESDNHNPIQCCHTLVISPQLSSSIICGLSAPDTIFFREQYYEPEAFNILVTAVNSGSGQTKNVVANLIQDQQFTILSPSQLALSDVFMSGDVAEGTYSVKVKPCQTDQQVKIRVLVQGDDTDPLWCEYPIFLQRERAPQFSLICSTPKDSLVYDEETGEYVPNPFEVQTVAENIGETYAEECEIFFAGPERFTPVGQTHFGEGTMQVGDTRWRKWQVIALPRTEGGWDTLLFQIRGKGGLGRKLVYAECRLPIYVPPTRSPRYEVSCSAPDSISFVGTEYQPNPFPVTMRIENRGDAVGRNLSPTLMLPPSITLDSGESQTKMIARLLPYSSVTVSWNVIAEPRAVAGKAKMCIRMVDSVGLSGECCREVLIPQFRFPEIGLACYSIDTLYTDKSSGEYLGNPFDVNLSITNTGGAPALDVKASISITGSNMQALDSVEQFVGNIPGGGSSAPLVWRVTALKRPDNANIPITLRVTSSNAGEGTCPLSVFIPAHRTAVLQASCSSNPEDTIHFDWDIGDFNPRTFTVSLNVTNEGHFPAEEVSAVLLPPPGISFVDNEQSDKSPLTQPLEPGETTTFIWQVQPMREREGADREFHFVARSNNTDEVACTDYVFVQGSPKANTVTLPRDVLFSYGQKGYLPITIDRTVGKDLSSYTFELTYDPDVISLLQVSNANSLTEIGWVGARMNPRGPGRVEITDYTTGTPLHTESGTLVNLYIEGVYRAKKGESQYANSLLHIAPSSALFNFGEIAVSSFDGNIYVTDECLVPLIGSESFALEQNRPNPFNPSTLIEFSIPSDEHTRLVVLDKMGREIAVVVDRALTKGRHTATFNAQGLASGVYFYRLQSGGRTETRKMVISQ